MKSCMRLKKKFALRIKNDDSDDLIQKILPLIVSRQQQRNASLICLHTQNKICLFYRLSSFFISDYC